MATTKAPKIETLQDIADSHKFDTEPIKMKKVGSAKVKVADWTLNSRHLLMHLFYNVLGFKAKGRGDKLPSIDEEALMSTKHPLAEKLIRYRKLNRICDSLKNASQFVRPGTEFDNSMIDAPNKAVMQFNPATYDNVERIFTVAEKSIPINADKRVRNTFIVPTDTVSADELDADSLVILKSISHKPA